MSRKTGKYRAHRSIAGQTEAVVWAQLNPRIYHGWIFALEKAEILEKLNIGELQFNVKRCGIQ